MDESISQNIIPGVCKSLENFLLVYEIDAIAKFSGVKILKLAGAASVSYLPKLLAQTKQESLFLVKEDLPDSYLSQKGHTVDQKWMEKERKRGRKLPEPHDSIQDDAWQTHQNWQNSQAGDRYLKRNQEEREREKYQREKDKFSDDQEREAGKNQREIERDQREKEQYKSDRSRNAVKNILDTVKSIKDIGSISIERPKESNISLEPTYSLATTSWGTTIIGIKVIPVSVKSAKGYSLAEMMATDLALPFFQTKLTEYKRSLIRFFWAVCRGARIIPFLSRKSNQVITRDPEKDILLASTFHRKYVFCLLNFADVQNSEFFREAGGINKLHNLGWNSIISADDVNQRIIWCMKEFHGLCSSTPYSFIYSTLGQTHAKAFTDMETIKRSTSSIFARTKSLKSILGESREVLNNYLKRIT